MDTIHNCARCGLSEMNNNRHTRETCISLLKQAVLDCEGIAERSIKRGRDHLARVEAILAGTR